MSLVLNLKTKTAYLCEVTTHILGINYKNNQVTGAKIKKKFLRQKQYAKKYLSNFKKHVFMFWSPVVPKGFITTELDKLKGLELEINEKYSKAIDELKEITKKRTNDEGNPFFRMLQIMGYVGYFRCSIAQE